MTYVMMFAKFFLGTMGIVLGLLVSLMTFTVLVKLIKAVTKMFTKEGK